MGCTRSLEPRPASLSVKSMRKIDLLRMKLVDLLEEGKIGAFVGALDNTRNKDRLRETPPRRQETDFANTLSDNDPRKESGRFLRCIFVQTMRTGG